MDTTLRLGGVANNIQQLNFCQCTYGAPFDLLLNKEFLTVIICSCSELSLRDVKLTFLYLLLRTVAIVSVFVLTLAVLGPPPAAVV